jgi:hypothetical protein
MKYMYGVNILNWNDHDNHWSICEKSGTHKIRWYWAPGYNFRSAMLITNASYWGIQNSGYKTDESPKLQTNNAKMHIDTSEILEMKNRTAL